MQLFQGFSHDLSRGASPFVQGAVEIIEVRIVPARLGMAEESEGKH